MTTIDNRGGLGGLGHLAQYTRFRPSLALQTDTM